METRMIISNPVTRFVLKAISACRLFGRQRDSAAGRSRRVEQTVSPFVLVAHAPDGRWGVFQQDFDKPLAVFDGRQEACDYANELARTRTGSMVLIGKSRGSVRQSGFTHGGRNDMSPRQGDAGKG